MAEAPAPPLGGPLIDTFGRVADDLRVSVTDRCNFRCTYCMPKEIFGPDFAFLPKGEVLTFEEIERVARAFVEHHPDTPWKVWYATPATTEAQRAQAAALLGALGHQLEVDDEKMVAMATAVSGTGPTYVFLVMEALIDAAVHLGFPRHIAHDLVIETLEGSTLFAKQSGMHPAELRNMVTSPGGTSPKCSGTERYSSTTLPRSTSR